MAFTMTSLMSESLLWVLILWGLMFLGESMSKPFYNYLMIPSPTLIPEATLSEVK